MYFVGIQRNNFYSKFVVNLLAKFYKILNTRYLKLLLLFFGSGIMTLIELLVTSKSALFLSNFTFHIWVSYVFSLNNLIMPNPDFSYKNGASTLKNVLYLGYTNPLCTGNKGTDMFKNLTLIISCLFLLLIQQGFDT